jgi:LPXTG-motif cell wall-anchored protein
MMAGQSLYDSMAKFAEYQYKEAVLKYTYKSQELEAARELAALGMIQEQQYVKAELEALGMSQEHAEQMVKAQSETKLTSESGWQSFGKAMTSETGKTVTGIIVIGAVVSVVVALFAIFRKKKEVK